MSEEVRKAKERISKLLNMTVENGATEDEQANAIRLAAGIAARLGIEVEACRPKDAPTWSRIRSRSVKLSASSASPMFSRS